MCWLMFLGITLISGNLLAAALYPVLLHGRTKLRKRQIGFSRDAAQDLPELRPARLFP